MGGGLRRRGRPQTLGHTCRAPSPLAARLPQRNLRGGAPHLLYELYIGLVASLSILDLGRAIRRRTTATPFSGEWRPPAILRPLLGVAPRKRCTGWGVVPPSGPDGLAYHQLFCGLWTVAPLVLGFAHRDLRRASTGPRRFLYAPFHAGVALLDTPPGQLRSLCVTLCPSGPLRYRQSLGLHRWGSFPHVQRVIGAASRTPSLPLFKALPIQRRCL